MASDAPILITINIGNTNTTAVEWREGGVAGPLEKWTSDFRSMKTIAERAAQATDILIASVVRQCSSKIVNDLNEINRNAHRFRADVPAPIEIVPQPSERVGDDRIAACLGALTLDPACPWVVVDAGTAVTVNAVSPGANGHPPKFEGGLIAPGASLCLRSLSQGTAQLPGLAAGAFEKSGFDFIGRNTEQAMLYGVLALQAAAVTAMIEGQRTMLGASTKVAITGGGASFLVEALNKNGAPKYATAHQANLVHLGLFSAWKASR